MTSKRASLISIIRTRLFSMGGFVMNEDTQMDQNDLIIDSVVEKMDQGQVPHNPDSTKVRRSKREKA